MDACDLLLLFLFLDPPDLFDRDLRLLDIRDLPGRDI